MKGKMVARKGADIPKMKAWDNLGVPRSKVSSKAGSIKKADSRGEGQATIRG